MCIHFASFHSFTTLRLPSIPKLSCYTLIVSYLLISQKPYTLKKDANHDCFCNLSVIFLLRSHSATPSTILMSYISPNLISALHSEVTFKENISQVFNVTIAHWTHPGNCHPFTTEPPSYWNHIYAETTYKDFNFMRKK